MTAAGDDPEIRELLQEISELGGERLVDVNAWHTGHVLDRAIAVVATRSEFKFLILGIVRIHAVTCPAIVGTTKIIDRSYSFLVSYSHVFGG